MTVGSTRHADLPQFSIVIPARKPDPEALNRTISSLLNQQALIDTRVELSVTVVLDDLSFAKTHMVVHERVRYLQESRSGLYSALVEGFRSLDGDFYGYLGVGDTYERTAFGTVADLAPPNPDEPWWLTGMIVTRRSNGEVVRALLPYRYRSSFFRTGIHGGVLPTIQAESTFWNSSVHKTLDLERLSRLQLAGDYFMWQSFIKVRHPVIVEAFIGSFQWHGDNLSGDWTSYRDEIESLSERPGMLLRLGSRTERLFWGLPNALKYRLNKRDIRRYVWPNGPWE